MRKNNMIAWYVILVDGRAISSAFYMAILLNWALFLLWCCRDGPWLFSEMNYAFSTVIYNGKRVPTLVILCEVFVLFSAPEILWSRLKNQGS